MKGIANLRSKLSEDDVRAIKQLLAQKVKRTEIMQLFGISKTQLYRIKRGEQWAHITIQLSLLEV